MKNRFSNNASLEAMKHADQHRIFVTRDMKVRSEIASILKTNKNEQSNNAIEFLKYWSGFDHFIKDICENDDFIFKKVKQILLEEVIINGDLDIGGGYGNGVGVAQLNVRGQNSEQTLNFFLPIVEDFAHVWIDEENRKEYGEVLMNAKSGNFEPFASFLRECTSASIPVPQPWITVENSGMTYITASGGCEVSIDIAHNLVGFRKLDITQGTGPYSYMRGGYFLNSIIQTLYHKIRSEEANKN